MEEFLALNQYFGHGADYMTGWGSIGWYGEASLVAQLVKNLPANAGDARAVGLIPQSGRSPGEGNGHPLQYSCLENSMDRGAWQASVHGVTKSQTQLNGCPHIHTHILRFHA